MATVTPHPTPKGGFPLRLTSAQLDGDTVSVTFPSSAAVEINRINLCPIPRPRAGSAWTSGAGATVTLGSTDAAPGLPNPQFISGDIAKLVSANGANTDYIDYAAATGLAAAASTAYNLSAYVFITAASVSGDVKIDGLQWDGSNVLTVAAGSVATLPSKGSWWRVTQPVTTIGGTAKLGIRISHSTPTTADVAYVTGAMIELANNAGSYFDGASEQEASWNGTAFASASTNTVDPAIYKTMQVMTAADTLAAAAS
jgi:hypothetical protein